MSTLAVTLTGIAPATLTIELGTPGPRGLPGATGATGATGPAGAPGVGVPAGGSTSQYLVKTSGVDFATGWQTLSLSGYLSLDGGSMNANAEIYFEDAVQGRVALASGSAFAVSSSSNPDLVSNILYDRVFSKNATSMTTLKPTGVEFPDLTFQTSAGITAATAASTYYPLSGNPSGFLTSASLSGYATLSSPAFSGVPTAPSAALGTDSDQIATTAFVQDSIIAGSAHAETLQASVRNETGSTLSAFTVVYITGASGNKATVSKAQANAEGTSSGTFGILETAIPNNQNGVAITAGVISGQDTSAFAEGAQLWLSPTVAGGVTTTKPAAPNHAVFIGVVTRVHANQGTVEVRIANGFELQELHNVSITSVANGDLLAYESATSLWKNKSISTLDLATESWVTSQGYLTSASLTGYALESWVTTQLGSYLTTSSAASTYQTLAGMSSYLTTSAAASTYAPIASPALTGNVTITTNSVGAALFIEQAGAGNILTLHDQASDTTFVAIDANGKVNTIPSTTTNAGFNVPHGVVPSTPVNGDIWTTTGGLFARINGSTAQMMDLSSTQNVGGNKTFINTNLTLGNSAGTSVYNLGTGATVSVSTKTVNIGTNGLSGSTTNITIGSAAGTSTTTLQGTTNGITVAADTNSVDLATTAFVVGQAGSATPIVDGTAAVGTSLRYARQDHVHPTDTSRAPLASPTFTGTVTIPAGASISGFAPLASPNFTGTPSLPTGTTAVTQTVGNNTTAVATTAFVLANAGAGAVTSVAGRTGAVVLSNTDISGLGTMAVETATNYLTTASAASTYQTISGMSSYLTTAAAAAGYYPLTGNPSGFLTSAPVTSVAGRTGAVTLSNTDISGLGTMATATAADYSTTTVANGLYYPLTGNPSSFITSSALTGYALESWVTTQLGSYLTTATAASTYQTQAGMSSYLTTATAASTYLTQTNAASTYQTLSGMSSYLTTSTAASTYAPLASPTLTGVPLSTTAAADTNTTQIATTAFVVGQVGTATPLANGTAAVGTSLKYARQDHVHPSDNNVKAWVNFNGTGTVAIRASMNISSITDNGVGDYTANFTTAFSDANYACAFSVQASGNTQGSVYAGAVKATSITAAATLKSTTQCQFITAGTGSAGDIALVMATFIR